jgi:peptidoglycan/LPS O-acetylase OafA/YrhL
MYTTTQKLQPNWRYIAAFIAKRLLRIVPLYFVCTLLYLAVYSKLNLYVFEHPQWLLPSLFFYPTYGSLTGPAYGFPALEVGWSLNYEIYFYLLIAICAFTGRWRWVVLISILLASVFIVPLITNGYVMQSLRQWYTYQLPPLF